MKKAIAFSGGKDSWAVLWLNKDELAGMPVLWVNTGKAYPETRAMVEKAKGICGEFHEIPSDQESFTQKHGLPADVVPVEWTVLGQQMTRKKEIAIQPYTSCCQGNIAMPMVRKARELGVTHILSGQRRDEEHRAPYAEGTYADGIFHLFPIQDWTRQDVISFLRQHMEIPPHFAIEHSSLDCYDCTAFSKASKDRIAFTRERYPQFYKQYLSKREKVDFAISEALNG